MTKNRWISFVEVFIFYSFVLFVIWGGRERRPATFIIVLCLFAICLGSTLYHRDSLERVGLSWKPFLPNLKWVSLTSAPLLIPLLILAWKHRYDGLWDAPFQFLGYPLWAFLQEYTLLAFVGNRLEEGLEGHPRLVPWINGFLFSVAHLPNPVLMTATFVSGTLFTWIFFKHRQLIPLSIIHALFGVGISMALGSINGIMSVGPGYYARLGTLPY